MDGPVMGGSSLQFSYCIAQGIATASRGDVEGDFALSRKERKGRTQ
jgi:hypothetical protein